MGDEPSAAGLHRWHLQMQLATCGFGAWYGKLTGDEATARRFDRVVQKMLRELKQESGLPKRPAGGVELASAAAPEGHYEQLALLP